MLTPVGKKTTEEQVQELCEAFAGDLNDVSDDVMLAYQPGTYLPGVNVLDSQSSQYQTLCEQMVEDGIKLAHQEKYASFCYWTPKIIDQMRKQIKGTGIRLLAEPTGLPAGAREELLMGQIVLIGLNALAVPQDLNEISHIFAHEIGHLKSDHPILRREMGPPIEGHRSLLALLFSKEEYQEILASKNIDEFIELFNSRAAKLLFSFEEWQEIVAAQPDPKVLAHVLNLKFFELNFHATVQVLLKGVAPSDQAEVLGLFQKYFGNVTWEQSAAHLPELNMMLSEVLRYGEECYGDLPKRAPAFLADPVGVFKKEIEGYYHLAPNRHRTPQGEVVDFYPAFMVAYIMEGGLWQDYLKPEKNPNLDTSLIQRKPNGEIELFYKMLDLSTGRLIRKQKVEDAHILLFRILIQAAAHLHDPKRPKVRVAEVKRAMGLMNPERSAGQKNLQNFTRVYYSYDKDFRIVSELFMPGSPEGYYGKTLIDRDGDQRADLLIDHSGKRKNAARASRFAIRYVRGLKNRSYINSFAGRGDNPELIEDALPSYPAKVQAPWELLNDLVKAAEQKAVLEVKATQDNLPNMEGEIIQYPVYQIWFKDKEGRTQLIKVRLKQNINSAPLTRFSLSEVITIDSEQRLEGHFSGSVISEQVAEVIIKVIREEENITF